MNYFNKPSPYKEHLDEKWNEKKGGDIKPLR